MRCAKIETPARRPRRGLVLGGLSVALALPRLAEACSVCWGASDSPQTQGTNNAVLFLLLIVVVVLSGMAGFFITLMRRSRLAATVPEKGVPGNAAPAKAAARRPEAPVDSRMELQETRNASND